MTEYICRDKVLSYVYATHSAGGFRNEEDYLWLQEAVVDAAAADVQPVKHAYWIELPKALNPNENPCKCSNCGHILSFMNYYPKSKYCPNCGARMDKEGNNGKSD